MHFICKSMRIALSVQFAGCSKPHWRRFYSTSKQQITLYYTQQDISSSNWHKTTHFVSTYTLYMLITIATAVE